MTIDTRSFLESADLGDVTETFSALEGTALNLDQLPPAVVSGTTLIDFSQVPSLAVRAGVSQAMLFASRVATKAMKSGDDEDDWLAAYTSNLAQLGFTISGSAVTTSTFKKTGVEVHKAIIPFLTIAFGGAALGPVILAGLQNLQTVNENAPWITLFDKETRRFEAQEMHFAAVSSTETDTVVRYAIARLHLASSVTSILFFKLSKTEAKFESATKTMTANNSFLALLEPELRSKLAGLATSFIAGADL